MIFWWMLLGFIGAMLVIRYFYRDKFTVKELAVGIAALFVLLGGGYLIASHDMTAGQLMRLNLAKKRRLRFANDKRRPQRAS